MSTPYDTARQDDEQVRAQVLIGADLFKVKTSGHAASGGGQRGFVTKFSKQSRKRMLELLAMIRLVFEGALFVGLTYPAVYSDDPKVWKRDLDVFLKRLRRRFPKVAGIWRIEFQRRGAPHFHLLIWGIKARPAWFRRWLSLAWYQVAETGDEKHLISGTSCRVIDSRRRAGYYVSKYAAKVGDVPCDPETGEVWNVGRWWGQFGDLPSKPVLTVTLAADCVFELRRMVARLLKSRRQFKSWRKSYARRLARPRRDRCRRGFSAFGLGDLSFEGWGSVFDSTAFAMVYAVTGS